jgi:hypothetical protein
MTIRLPFQIAFGSVNIEITLATLGSQIIETRRAVMIGPFVLSLKNNI